MESGGLPLAVANLEVACSAGIRGNEVMVRPLAPLRSEHSINCERFRMSRESINLGKLVRDERQKWQDGHLLAPGAIRDFQKLCDEAFHSLRGKYYRPADLVAEMRLRRRLRIKVPRKTGHAQKIDVSPSKHASINEKPRRLAGLELAGVAGACRITNAIERYPRLNAFCRVAPSVRFRVPAMLAAPRFPSGHRLQCADV